MKPLDSEIEGTYDAGVQEGLRRAAKIAESFSMKPDRSLHPDIPWEQMREEVQAAAHSTAQQIAGEIRTALREETEVAESRPKPPPLPQCDKQEACDESKTSPEFPWVCVPCGQYISNGPDAVIELEHHGHQMIVVPRGKDILGRRVSLVACATCSELVHEATTGPSYFCRSHVADREHRCKVCRKPVREGLIYCSGLSECWKKETGII